MPYFSEEITNAGKNINAFEVKNKDNFVKCSRFSIEATPMFNHTICLLS